MNRLLNLFLATLLVNVSLAQDTITNVKGSEYRFDKIYHLTSTPVLNQGYTGTCWSFSGLSFFESELIRMGHEQIDLSEMYVVRKAYQLKAEKYVRLNGNINFSEGGSFQDIPFVVSKYGLVPSEVYSGYGVLNDAHDHAEMFAVLNGAVTGLLEYQVTETRGIKTSETWKEGLSGILDAYLGTDITSFSYGNKEYTPQSFANSLGLDMNSYYSLTSFEMYPWYTECILEIPDNWSWGKSYNVHLDDLVNVVIDALKNGYTVGWDADVSEDGFSFRNGLAINPQNPEELNNSTANFTSNAFLHPVKELTVGDADRQESFNNKTTTDDHLMHIVGLYKDQNDTNYFLVKNSWGTGNLPDGFLYVSESYFRAKTINIFLHKDGIEKSILKNLKLH